MAAGRGDGLSLDTPKHWAMTIEVAQAAAFFDALQNILPPDSILYFEGTTIAPEVAAFYSQHRAPNPVAVARDTIFPIPETFHVRFSPEICVKMKEYFTRLAPPEIFDHIKAYRGETLLFTFHDGFDNALLISQHVPKSAIDQFCAALNLTAEEEETILRDTKSLESLLKLMQDPNAMRKIKIAGEPRWRTWWRKLTGR